MGAKEAKRDEWMERMKRNELRWEAVIWHHAWGRPGFRREMPRYVIR